MERGKKAQLAYSFEIALQNEFTIEENIALARQFLLDNFVSRGMTVDVAFHTQAVCGVPDGKVDMQKLSEEYDTLVQTHTTTYEQFKSVREDLQRLWKVKPCVDTAARSMGRTKEQKLQNQLQTRHKKEDISL